MTEEPEQIPEEIQEEKAEPIEVKLIKEPEPEPKDTTSWETKDEYSETLTEEEITELQEIINKNA